MIITHEELNNLVNELYDISNSTDMGEQNKKDLLFKIIKEFGRKNKQMGMEYALQYLNTQNI